MIERVQYRGAELPWPRRALGALGTAVIGGTHRLLLFLSFAATVLMVAMRRGAWHGPVWIEFKRVLHEVAVRSLPTTVATGMLVGFALVTQAVYWLEQTGTQGLVGPIIVVILIREFTPILIGLILFGRSGTATLIELGEAQTRGWLRLFELQGLDPLVHARAAARLRLRAGRLLPGHGTAGLHPRHGLPRGLRAGAGRPTRSGISPTSCCAPRRSATSSSRRSNASPSASWWRSPAAPPASARRDESDELKLLVPRGFVRSALAILVVNSLFDLVA